MLAHDQNIKISEDVKKKLEERHILEEDIKMVISRAEESGEKLYKQGKSRFLAKMITENATFYVEYSIASGNDVIIHTAYSHRAIIEG
jgi:hypothetical protein